MTPFFLVVETGCANDMASPYHGVWTQRPSEFVQRGETEGGNDFGQHYVHAQEAFSAIPHGGYYDDYMNDQQQSSNGQAEKACYEQPQELSTAQKPENNYYYPHINQYDAQPTGGIGEMSFLFYNICLTIKW